MHGLVEKKIRLISSSISFLLLGKYSNCVLIQTSCIDWILKRKLNFIIHLKHNIGACGVMSNETHC